MTETLTGYPEDRNDDLSVDDFQEDSVFDGLDSTREVNDAGQETHVFDGDRDLSDRLGDAIDDDATEDRGVNHFGDDNRDQSDRVDDDRSIMDKAKDKLREFTE